MVKKLLFISLSLLFTEISSAQDFNRKNLEQTIQNGIKKAYAASVRIWGIDTLTGKQNSAQFSGVIIDAAGHILTAAHAIVPGKKYKVIFTDGKEYTAEGLGRMGFEPKTGRPDAAVIRIIEKGIWAFAEMGWSYSLKVNEPCISIAYPTTLNQSLPTVRVGQISNPLTVWGFVESTRKMEPGDSGGPLFDYMGRVVALHSRIERAEDVNFEIPVDTYRKYWSSLTIAEDYKAYPTQEDAVKTDPKEAGIIAVKELENLTATQLGVQGKFEASTVLIKSKIKGQDQQINGTVLLPDGKVFKPSVKDGTLILSKSSMVGSEVKIILPGSEVAEATVVARDKENDLVLLKIAIKLKKGVKLNPSDTVSLAFRDIGRFLISPMTAASDNRLSVLSSGYINQPIKFSSGYFGASANFINQQIILTRINPGSPAELATLELKDQITGINGVPISKPEHYGAELMKYAPGDTITIQGVRAGNNYNLKVGLTKMPARPVVHPADLFDGGKSFRLDGFERVFAHDAIIKPNECGSPVFDADGKFYGINIARFSRTSTLVVPVIMIQKFLNNL
ncbi:trypsin-like peptidase domain-containing protein [Pedobacter sp. MC2016-14]|uniref:trypsin-like peptidase domain-containing protein n=1 Tax=Pedobacter sp. MC2016-14 TaxID=2897327 RepID=UPI001E59AF79|nr:trypsin-like peptidase domain-containing protein [Pedobacter sp. MC2016-14]MCD0490413.1 trypsin-like peptidase domain-containing protein [Pedobacter sp. MC2016-14]